MASCSEVFQPLPIGFPGPVADEGNVGDAQFDRQSVRAVSREHHLGGRLKHDQQEIGEAQGPAGPGEVFQTRLHVRDDKGAGQGLIGLVDEVTDRDVCTARSTRARLLGTRAQQDRDVVWPGVPVPGHQLRWRETGRHVTFGP